MLEGGCRDDCSCPATRGVQIAHSNLRKKINLRTHEIATTYIMRKLRRDLRQLAHTSPVNCTRFCASSQSEPQGLILVGDTQFGPKPASCRRVDERVSRGAKRVFPTQPPSWGIAGEHTFGLRVCIAHRPGAGA